MKKIVVLGAGESGVGAAILAKKIGYEVFVSDKGSIKENYKEELRKHKIAFEEGNHTKTRLFETNEVVKSPGIPDKVPLIQELKKKGIPVISEIEFAAKHTNATLIGITGSNGKTTTTNLTYHLLKTAGLNVGIGGNVGYSFARLIAEEQRDLYVLELSSFQLDGIQTFCPDVAILLNITPDHLDRYEYKMDNYIASKFSIIKNQKENDLFIYNALDENITSFLVEKKIDQETIFIKDDFYKNKKLIVDQNTVFDTSACSLKGQHNMFNAICAIHAAKRLGVKNEAIQEGLNSFINAPHRLEHVAEFDNVEFINDSKATNVDAVYYALAAMEKPVVWVVGGKDKGNDYSAIESLVEEKVKAIVCLGVDNSKLFEVFSPMIKTMEETQDTFEAVNLAKLYAENGDVVLLSPACASFDLFNNYIHRGDEFKKAVLKLKELTK